MYISHTTRRKIRRQQGPPVIDWRRVKQNWEAFTEQVGPLKQWPYVGAIVLAGLAIAYIIFS